MFLDRDGTLNVNAPEGCYISAPSALRLLPGTGRSVRRLNEAGILVLVVTNQRGVALGKMTLADVDRVNQELQRRLRRSGARVDRFYVCPHEAGTCRCRKPLPALLLRANRDYPRLHLPRCVAVGDTESDVEAGLAAGCTAIRLGPKGTGSRASTVCPNLTAAVDLILARSSSAAQRRLDSGSVG